MTGTRYSSDSKNGLITSSFDGVTALFHRRSGITHVVMEPVPEILDALCDGPLDLPALLNALNVDDHADNRAALQARVDELIASGLVFTS
jgi:PqqD family protein of HPr-rel-A system